jgi:hypothetical protein
VLFDGAEGVVQVCGMVLVLIIGLAGAGGWGE